MAPAKGYTVSYSFKSAPGRVEADSYQVVLLRVSSAAIDINDEYGDDEGCDGDGDDEDSECGVGSRHDGSASSADEDEYYPPILLCLHESWRLTSPPVKGTRPFAIHVYRDEKGNAQVVGGDALSWSKQRRLAAVTGARVKAKEAARPPHSPGSTSRWPNLSQCVRQAWMFPRFLASLLLLVLACVARVHYEMALIADSPSCVLPGAYQNITRLATEYTGAIASLFDPFAVELKADQQQLASKDGLGVDILTPSCAIPQLYLEPDTILLRFADEISTLCQCIPPEMESGLHAHLAALCRQHAEQRQPPRDIYSAWTPAQHLELSEARAWSLGYSIPVVRFLHDLSREMGTAGQEQDSKADGDSVKISIRIAAISLSQVRYWLTSFQEGLVGRDYNLVMLDNIVQGLDSRQAYIVDWAKRYILPHEKLKVNESLIFPEKQSKEWRCATSVDTLFGNQRLVDGFSTTRDRIHTSAETLQRIMVDLNLLNHTLTDWIHSSVLSHGYLRVWEDDGRGLPVIAYTGTATTTRPSSVFGRWRQHLNNKGVVLGPQVPLMRLVAYYTPWLDRTLARAVCIPQEEPFYIGIELDARADALEKSVTVVRERRKATEARRTKKRS